MNSLKGKKVTVAGLARSGMAAAFLLKRQGAEVYATDAGDSDALRRNAILLKEAGIEVETGVHSRGFIAGKDLIVVSPAVPEDSVIFKWAREEGVPVIGEIELGYLCCEAPIIAVTGTNGKSTTTTLIGEILRVAGKDAVVCGNIGNPFCGELHRLKKDSIAVIEVSSFQLESIKSFKPFVSVVLNVSQNHFDRHPDPASYIAAKSRILENQESDDWAVLNYDDPAVRELGKKTNAKVIFFSRLGNTVSPVRKMNFSNGLSAGCYEDGSLFVFEGKHKCFVSRESELKIKGPHNIENILACISVASVFNISADKIRRALTGFKGLEHRFELVAAIGGIDFINDSKATTVLAVKMALESCDKPVILIAGGHDKGSDFKVLRSVISSKVKKVVLIGEAKEKIRRHLNGTVPFIEADSMEDAVKKAYLSSSPGDCVLLSPMCASFDMFRDFEERGKVFKEAVLKCKT